MKGFLKGLSLSLILSSSGVLQMYIYEGSKIIYDQLSIPEMAFTEKSFICGSFSKFFAVMLTYPFTTVRTRIQQNQHISDFQTAKYVNVNDVVGKIIRGEGALGFYKGILPNMMKGIPQRGIYFYFYELFKSKFIDNSSNSCYCQWFKYNYQWLIIFWWPRYRYW